MLNLSNKIKIKPLTKQQLIVSIDRLTRFKPPEDKYLRVFSEIILSNLISPKYSKKEVLLLDYSVLTSLAEQIINNSLVSIGVEPSANFSINIKLKDYENSVFISSNEASKLLDNEIDYFSFLQLIKNENSIPINLKWLQSIAVNEDTNTNRESYSLKYPIRKLVITEGITEEILLPRFAQITGCDFDKIGVHLISAGGKNQVVKLFYKYSEILKIPIFILLDKDAQENHEEIKAKLRPQDEVHVIPCGEFEDILPHSLIKKTLNQIFKNFSTVSIKELRVSEPMTKILANIFKQRGMEFKKACFAQSIEKNISSERDLTEEISKVIKCCI